MKNYFIRTIRTSSDESSDKIEVKFAVFVVVAHRKIDKIVSEVHRWLQCSHMMLLVSISAEAPSVCSITGEEGITHCAVAK